MRRTFVQDAAAVLGSRVVVLILAFFGRVIVARSLGPAGIGILAALLVYPRMLLTFADFGVRQASVYHLGKGSYSDRRILSAILTLLGITSVLGILVVAAVYGLLDNPNFQASFIFLALLGIPLQLTVSYSSGVFLGKERIPDFNQNRWVPQVFKFLGILGFVWLGGLQVLGALLANTLSWLVIGTYAAWRVAKIIPIRSKMEPDIVKELLKLGSVYAVAIFVLQLNYRIDLVLLERLSSASELGYYSVGVSLAEQLWQIPTALGIVVFSRSANADDASAFSRRVSRILRLALLASAAGALVLYAVAPVAVPLIFGEEFTPSVEVIRYILPGVVAFTAVKILNMDMAGRGRPNLSLFATIPAVVVNVALNIFLIPRLGASGAALASTLSYVLAALIFIGVYAHAISSPVTTVLRYKIQDFGVLRDLIVTRFRSNPTRL